MEGGEILDDEPEDEELEEDRPIRRKKKKPVKKGVPLWVWLTAGGLGLGYFLCVSAAPVSCGT